MIEETGLNFAKRHLDAWLTCTPWTTLADVLAAQPVRLHGRDVVETKNIFGAVSGVDRESVERLVQGDYEGYVSAIDNFINAFEGSDAEYFHDGTYIRED